MLTEQEWKNISNILLELYTLKNINELSAKLLRVLRILIPYTKGYFLFFNENREIIKDYTDYFGFEECQIDEYLKNYYSEDYLQYLMDISQETTVYKDTNIISESIRKSTQVYKKFLTPFDIPYGSGILVIHKGKICAVFSIFRSGAMGDFTEKDLYILEILKHHLENMVESGLNWQQQKGINGNLEKNFCFMEESFSLTRRETEILKLLSHGKSNMEIADKLCVSLSTIKKHIYNLYSKTGVSSRTQLLNLIYN